MKPALDATSPSIAARTGLPWKRLLALVLVAVTAVLPFVLGNYDIFLVTQVMIYAVAVLGLDILYGRTGQLSLAHASFFGVGAYIAALSSAFGIFVMLQPLIVLAVAIVLGAIVAIPTLRLSGLRLALVTLLFGELFIWVINHTTGMTGGSQGMIVPPIELGGFDSSDPYHAYGLAAVASLLATLACVQLGRTQYGRRMLAVRDSELASASMGIPVARTKIVAFILSATLAGVAGWIYAYVVGFISPTTFDLFGSVNFLIAVILGGSGSVLGAWLGALYIVLMPELFSSLGYTNLFPIVGGGVMIVVALLVPGGLVGGIERLIEAVRPARKGDEP
jgi:branched-chain amino acid transport system permease protein